jgi:uncharacterized protein (TIGR02231 family)
MFAAFLVAALLSQEPVRSVPSTLDRVTVYDGQALVERLVATTAELAGPVTIVVGPFPAQVNPASFQTEVVSGDVLVLGLETRTRAGEAMAEGEREVLRKDLAEQQVILRQLGTELAGVAIAQEALQAFIQSIAAGKGAVDGLVSAEQTMTFVREQMRKLDGEKAVLERQQIDVRAIIADLEQQLAPGDRRNQPKFLELRLALHFQRPGEGVLRISYLAQGARWDPTYDVRVAPDLTGVKVGFVAQVTQSTGEDWTEAEIRLSTSAPSIGLDPPELPLRTVHPFDGNSERLSELGYSDGGFADVAAAPAAERDFAEAPKVEFRDFGLSAQFILPGRKSVPTNGEAHRFLIREVPLEVRPERYVVPSMSDKAYLRADVKLASGAPLLAGEARIFLGPDYLGMASFPLLRVGDSTMLNLGVDPNLTVEWETIEDTRDNPSRFSISSTARITRVYRATLRLSASARGSIQVMVEEALPLARDSRVEVRVVQIQPAFLDTEQDQADRNERGIHRWRLTLAPGAAETVRWGYVLSFDEDLYPVLQEN